MPGILLPAALNLLGWGILRKELEGANHSRGLSGGIHGEPTNPLLGHSQRQASSHSGWISCFLYMEKGELVYRCWGS